MTNSIISGNTSIRYGGGLSNDWTATLTAVTISGNRAAVMTPFANVARVIASTVLGDRVHAEGAGIVKLVGWSDEFLPVVINTTQTLNQR
jgi:hypothetical protein